MAGDKLQAMQALGTHKHARTHARSTHMHTRMQYICNTHVGNMTGQAACVPSAVAPHPQRADTSCVWERWDVSRRWS